MTSCWPSCGPRASLDCPTRIPEDAVILASIVEKETALADERPRIAGLFINRLKKGMKLEFDPTIIYGLTRGRPLGHGIRQSEMALQTPYNTYLIDGLPPTPIANPGKDALSAALQPADTQELYFVADGTGGHVFAATFEEHRSNVQRWRQIEAAGPPGGGINAMTPAAPRARRGLMLVISSPSGAGKTSLSRRLVADHADLSLSISATTRPPRPGEADGREYHFVTGERFDQMVRERRLPGKRGGARTPLRLPARTDHAGPGRRSGCLFDIDWQGAKAIAAAAPGDVVRVFILPPSMADLRRRLYARAQDQHDVIERRLGRAKGEIAMWADYDYVIVNEDFDLAYADLAHVYHAERLKRVRNPGLTAFVDALLAEDI